ncbi:ZIP family metal transporter [Candidatus Saccharibacteria bacterium]|nr:ZIP family metal transporter [Candidatus Saccharibacteria bacterium]
MEILNVLFWTLIGSVFSLIGGVILLKSTTKREKFVHYALPFGAGAMLASAFLVVIPEALHEGLEPVTMSLFTLSGFLGFFLLERLLSWFHHHHHDSVAGVRDKTHTYLVVIGDTLHNAIDGVALGAAFLVSSTAGVSMAIAVAAHEIPQEVGDFGILLAKGVKTKRVIWVNIASALATVVTAMTVFLLGSTSGLDTSPLMAIAAGMFIYVAASDIIPDIHERPRAEGRVQSLMLFLGVAIIGSIALIMSH